MPSIIIDSGAAFFKQPALPEHEKEAAKRTAEGIAQAIQIMGTLAVGISPFDLTEGVEYLKQLATAKKLTPLSMNLYPNQGTDPIFRPYLVTQAGKLEIAVLGLTGHQPKNRNRHDFHVLPWQETLETVLKQVEEADMIILLSSANRRTNEEIAQKFDNIHIILQSGQHGNNLAPVNINNTLLCQTASRGKYLGLLQIDWNESKTWGEDTGDILQKEQDRLDRINWQIGRMQKRASTTELASNKQFQQLLQIKSESEQTVQMLKTNNDGRQKACIYRNSFIALETSLPEDKTIKAIVDESRREVNQIRRKAAQKRQRKQKGAISNTNRQTFPAALKQMVGWKACKECHPKQVNFYLQTNHSRAWQTLVAKNQQYNPECIACHVTLPTYDANKIEKENLLSDIPSELQGVGCETCHGPSRGHSERAETIAPTKPDQANCLRCHTEERDNNFDFSRKIKKVACPPS